MWNPLILYGIRGFFVLYLIPVAVTLVRISLKGNDELKLSLLIFYSFRTVLIFYLSLTIIYLNQKTMKSKFALALDLLEQELDVLNKEQQSVYLGGDGSNGYSSNSVCPNGYCYFNALAYVGQLVGGGYASSNCSTYVSSYQQTYGTSDFIYDSNGNFLGIQSTHEDSFTNSQFYTAQLATGTFLASGKPVMAMINSIGPNGESLTHEIVITQFNSNGSYGGYDPSECKPITLYPEDIRVGSTVGIYGSR